MLFATMENSCIQTVTKHAHIRCAATQPIDSNMNLPIWYLFCFYALKEKHKLYYDAVNDGNLTEVIADVNRKNLNKEVSEGNYLT